MEFLPDWLAKFVKMTPERGEFGGKSGPKSAISPALEVLPITESGHLAGVCGDLVRGAGAAGFMNWIDV